MMSQFDHEKLEVYQKELKFIAWLVPLFGELAVARGASVAEVRDQLDRASLSALLNTAEGNGKRQQRVRAKFFDDARGSASECAACLDALVAKGLCGPERVQEGKTMLLRVVSMLTRLVQLYSGDCQVRESQQDYRARRETET